MTRFYLTLVIFCSFISPALNQTEPLLLGTTSAGGSANTGTIYSVTPDGTDSKIRHNFSQVGPHTIFGGLTLADDNFLYGVAYDGGLARAGAIFKISPDGTEYTVIHQFSEVAGSRPRSAPIEGSDGKLYGTTGFGGMTNQGTIYSIKKDGSDFTLLHSFNGAHGEFPFGSLLEGSDGNLYGMSTRGGDFGDGTFYKIAKDGSGFSSLFSFNGLEEGREPFGGFIEDADGNLYGNLLSGGPSLGGTVFKINKDGTGLTLLKTFPFATDDGSLPYGTLLEASDGKLYGTTFSGGASFVGTIFSLEKNGNNYALLHQFAPIEGKNPFAGNKLTEAINGSLIGTTRTGGAYDKGVIYEINKDGSEFNLIHEFNEDGANPYPGLILINGKLFGTNSTGGESGGGMVFSMQEDGSDYSTLKDFSKVNENGFFPTATPVKINDDWTYGSTQEGGNFGFGTIYRISNDGSTFETVHHFNGTNGKRPASRLLFASDGNIYGTALDGGDFGNGTIYKINPVNNDFTLLHTFSIVGEKGAVPRAGLIEGSDGKLYGAAQSGGNNGAGTIFRLDKNGNNLEAIFHFSTDGNSGRSPSFNILENSDGQLYGVTIFGGSTGSNENGTLFKLNKDGSGFTVLKNFNENENGSPSGPLSNNNDGYLYGVTENGGDNLVGTIYRIKTDDQTFETIYHFDVTNGISPRGKLLTNTADGWIYGIANRGGNNDAGVIFRIAPDGSVFEKTIDFEGFMNSGSRPDGGLLWYSPASLLNNLTLLEGIKISPNPSSGPVSIITDRNFPYLKNATLEIFDEAGSLLYFDHGKINQINSSINEKSIFEKNGIYIISIIIDTEYFSEKLIMQK